MKHFRMDEFLRSATARKLGIANRPSRQEEHNIEALVANVLDPLREAVGVPITVTSGYRCPLLNRAIGGAATSQHTKGEAADITAMKRRNTAQLFHIIRERLPFDQLIWENGDDEAPAWVHVSYKAGANRGEVLRFKNGRYERMA